MTIPQLLYFLEISGRERAADDLRMADAVRVGAAWMWAGGKAADKWVKRKLKEAGGG